jgi:hypothetical protein
MMRGLKLTALFLGFGGLGVGGGWAMGLFAGEAPWGGSPPDIRVSATSDDPVEVDVDVSVLGRSGRCAYEAERRVALDASAGEWLRLSAGSGELSVQGRAGLTRVQAVARACASDEEALQELTLTLERGDRDVVLSAHYPDRRGWDNDYARLDMVVEVPLHMAVDIDDSSGSMEVGGTGETRIEDSSGSILVREIEGPLWIDDSSGEIDVKGVSGDVEIEDGSGEVDVANVGGTVHVRDGSGSISVYQVEGDVIVDSDGSGSISVRDVRGDFRVGRDGSGGIRYSGIAGQVDIPRDKRDRTRGGR